MKHLIAIFYSLSLLLIFACNNNKNTPGQKSFHVWGNNTKCKATIEKACLTDGVSEATWDQDSRLLKLKIDTTLTSYSNILKLVANAGYDNELFFGNDYAYSKLEAGCQYERREE
jgi:hypothetical protein